MKPINLQCDIKSNKCVCYNVSPCKCAKKKTFITSDKKEGLDVEKDE